MPHPRNILMLFFSVFVWQAQPYDVRPLQSTQQPSEHFRITKTKLGELVREPLRVLPDGQQRYIIELDAPTLLDQTLQLRQSLTDPAISASSAIAAPVLLQLDQQLQAVQQQLVNELEQNQLISETFARTHTLVNTLVVAAKPESVAKISAIPGVKKVHPDRELELHIFRSVEHIGAKEVWKKTDANNMSIRGDGIRVGVIDTGIDYNHLQMGGCFGEGCKVAGGYDFYDNDADPIDTNGHGTHVAGIIAADGTILGGVAPHAALYAYRVCADVCLTSYVVQALERAADPDQNLLTYDALDVVNLSLGGPGNTEDILTIAANKASQAGIVVVVSAGNNGNASNAIGSPGNAELAITVAASDRSLDTMTNFSSRGPSVSDVVFKPDLAAPGNNIGSLGIHENSATKSGTSMAAAHVAGAAALLKQQQKSRTPAQVKSLLVNSAKNLQAPIEAQGSGRVDVLAAANASLTFSPQSISFGKLDTSKPLWIQQKSLVLHNTAATSSTVTLELPTLPAGVTLTIGPASTVTIAAGASQEIQIKLIVDPTIYQIADGAIVEDLSLTIKTAQASYRFALAFLAYQQLTIASSEFINKLQVYNEKGLRFYNDSAWNNMPLRMPSGTFDLIASFSNATDQRLVVLEQQVINQQQTLTIDPALAVHKISLASVTDREGTAVPLDELVGGIHALEIRKQSVPVYYLQMHGILGQNSFGTQRGQTLTEQQPLLVSSFSDKFQLAIAAYWQDRRPSPDDIQIYSWTQRFNGMNKGEIIDLDAKTQNRLVTKVAATPFNQKINFSYSVVRNLYADQLSKEDGYGISGYGFQIASLSENQPGTVSIYGTAASLLPHYGVGLFDISIEANNSQNTISGMNWRLFGDQGAARFSAIDSFKYCSNGVPCYFDKPKVYNLNPQGQQILTTMPHWAYFSAYENCCSPGFTVHFSSLFDIYGNQITHRSSPQNKADNHFLMRCDHRPSTAQQSEEFSFIHPKDCDLYDAELKYMTALLDQPTVSFSRLFTPLFKMPERFANNEILIRQVRIGYNNQPSQLISEGTGFFELAGDYLDTVSAEIHYQGKWRPLNMQRNTSNDVTLPVFRAEFALPNSAALASVRYIVKQKNGNALETVFHNAAIIGPKPDTAMAFDHDKDGTPDYQDPDDDNDGISDIDELRYRLDIYQDDRTGDLDNDGLTNLQELELLTFPDKADTDTDGIADGFEHKYGLKPLDNSDALLDPDQDSLNNLQEFGAKTDPTKADTDGDTLPDGWEVQYGLDPLDAANATLDPDQDGLDNLTELQHKTDPTKADTDADGLPDGWEVKYSFNPLDAANATLDPDQDQLTNLQELQHKTDPTKADTDGDGLPDGWEVKYSLNPLDPADASSDRDNDGATALQEFSRGTDPTVSNLVSKPVTSEQGSSDGGSVGWSMLLLFGIVGWRRWFANCV